jgi:hypothetical protein
MTKHITTPQDLREMADDCERFNDTPPIQAAEVQRLYLRITRYAPRYFREAAEQLESRDETAARLRRIMEDIARAEFYTPELWRTWIKEAMR